VDVNLDLDANVDASRVVTSSEQRARVSVSVFEFVFEGGERERGALKRVAGRETRSFEPIGCRPPGPLSVRSWGGVRGRGCLEAVQLLRLAPARDVETVMALLDRLRAMLTRLAGLTHRRDSPRSPPT